MIKQVSANNGMYTPTIKFDDLKPGQWVRFTAPDEREANAEKNCNYYGTWFQIGSRKSKNILNAVEYNSFGCGPTKMPLYRDMVEGEKPNWYHVEVLDSAVGSAMVVEREAARQSW